MHNLAQSLIMKTGVRQDGYAKIRLVQSCGPSRDPVFVTVSTVFVKFIRQQSDGR
jgi:hypothetical protein